MASQELSERLRNLARKSLAQAHHPQRENKPEEREILEHCADHLSAELRKLERKRGKS
jgi:hypothetical protein